VGFNENSETNQKHGKNAAFLTLRLPLAGSATPQSEGALVNHKQRENSAGKSAE